ncbi:MAG: holo-ACP synthase [Myxococcales bacterium]|nr:holo-ACP synthase [Myxococcales bacterium]
MIVGLGIDVEEIERLEAALARSGPKIAERLFTEREREDALGLKNASEFLTGRYAAKEALFKALGTGVSGGITWRDAEVTNAPGGAPEIRIQGRAREVFDERGARRVWLSITHTGRTAAAVVVLEA